MSHGVLVRRSTVTLPGPYLNLLCSPPLLYLLPHPTLRYGDGFYSLHVSPQLFDFARLLRTRTYSLRPTMGQDAPR